MGMLAYGAMAGVGDEWLKQSGETRQADFQEIRDKRLSELKKGESTHAAELVTKENKRKEGVDQENFTFGYGDNVVRDGEVKFTGDDRPLASSTKTQGSPITLTNGDQTTEEQLRKTYDSIWKANTNEFGERIGDFDLPSYDDWRNDRVAAQHRINPGAKKKNTTPGTASTSAITQATEEANKMNSGFTPITTDKDIFGGLSQADWVQKRGLEIDNENATAPKGEEGMLTEGTKEKGSSQKLQQPLTKAAKTDPMQMYDELQAQNFDEQDILDTIRQHFHDPNWDIPPNALK